MERVFVVLRSRGPAWDDSKPLEGQADWSGHSRFMEGLYRDGFVALVGPLEGTRDALVIVRASSADEINQRLANLHVKVGGRYPMDDGHIVVDAVEQIALKDITYDLARESGFESVKALLDVAKHGRGRNVYLIRFHYLPPGGWDTPRRPSR